MTILEPLLWTLAIIAIGVAAQNLRERIARKRKDWLHAKRERRFKQRAEIWNQPQKPDPEPRSRFEDLRGITMKLKQKWEDEQKFKRDFPDVKPVDVRPQRPIERDTYPSYYKPDHSRPSPIAGTTCDINAMAHPHFFEYRKFSASTDGGRTWTT